MYNTRKQSTTCTMGREGYVQAANTRRKATEDVAEEARRRFVKAFGKIFPFGAQVVASAAAYTVGVTATQLLGFAFKVSCATPVLGPCMGVLGVGLANALAGQASKHTHKLITQGGNPLQKGFWDPLDVDDVVLDAVLGVCIFKAMGGRFSSLMPSDLSKPGSLAFESIPARPESSQDYAKPSVKRELARIFKRDGCHHCGSRRGPVIGDHMPPNKLVSSKESLTAMLDELPVVSTVRGLMGVAGRGPKSVQRFYPQCQKCSMKQATALRNGRRVLVLHLHAPRYRSEHLAGVFVGIRHNMAPISFEPPPSGQGRGSSGSRWNPLHLTAADETATNGSQGGSNHMQLLAAQSLVPDNVHSWELGMHGFSPAVSPAPSQGDGVFDSTSKYDSIVQHHPAPQQYHMQIQQCGQGLDSRSSSRQAGQPDGLKQEVPGSIGVLGQQHQLGDVLQEFNKEDSDGSALLAPEHARQRAEAAFKRHFAAGLAC
eukprot:GHRR01002652.1.p1 GENE.GHRR01002652.1~~GHRR01002652.1.p1  ORF type:complete len:486 (+),score=185.20 GHRR01002652.1:512-1969(+)